MKRFTFASLLVVFSLILAACASAATPAQPTAAPTEAPAATATAAPAQTSAPTATSEPTQAPQTIVDIAAGDGRFKPWSPQSRLPAWLEPSAAKAPSPSLPPPMTLSPSCPPAPSTDLLKPENKQQLVDILTYHVVPGKVMAADVANLTEADTVLGEKLAIKTDMGKVYVNDAKVAPDRH